MYRIKEYQDMFGNKEYVAQRHYWWIFWISIGNYDDKRSLPDCQRFIILHKQKQLMKLNRIINID